MSLHREREISNHVEYSFSHQRSHLHTLEEILDFNSLNVWFFLYGNEESVTIYDCLFLFDKSDDFLACIIIANGPKLMFRFDVSFEEILVQFQTP